MFNGRGSGRGGRGGGGFPSSSYGRNAAGPVSGASRTDTLHVLVTDARYPLTEDMMVRVFEGIARVVSVLILPQQQQSSNGGPEMTAIVRFSSPEEAEAALDARNNRHIYSDCNKMIISFTQWSSFVQPQAVLSMPQPQQPQPLQHVQYVDGSYASNAHGGGGQQGQMQMGGVQQQQQQMQGGFMTTPPPHQQHLQMHHQLVQQQQHPFFHGNNSGMGMPMHAAVQQHPSGGAVHMLQPFPAPTSITPIPQIRVGQAPVQVGTGMLAGPSGFNPLGTSLSTRGGRGGGRGGGGGAMTAMQDPMMMHQLMLLNQMHPGFSPQHQHQQGQSNDFGSMMMMSGAPPPTVFLSCAYVPLDVPLQTVFLILEAYGGVVSIRRNQSKNEIVTVKMASTADADACVQYVRHIPLGSKYMNAKRFPKYTERHSCSDDGDPRDVAMHQYDFTTSRHRSTHHRSKASPSKLLKVTLCPHSEADIMAYFVTRNHFPEAITKEGDHVLVRMDSIENAVKLLVDCQNQVCNEERSNVIFVEDPLASTGEGQHSATAHQPRQQQDRTQNNQSPQQQANIEGNPESTTGASEE